MPSNKQVIALTIRLPRSEWLRLHELANNEGVSIQALTVEALNMLFKARHQKPLKVETRERIKAPE